MTGMTLQDQLLSPPDKRVYIGIPRPRYGPSIAVGMIGGIIMLGLWSLMGRVVDGLSSWQPSHQLAAVFLGTKALDPIGSYDLQIIAVAVAMVLVAGGIVGVALSRIVIGAKARTAPLIGLVAGAALYGITFYGFAYFAPWLANARGIIPLAAFLVATVTMTLLYRPFKFQRRPTDLQ